MGDGFQNFDIILFAMVAAFLVLQLRRVLGRRTGNEKPPNEAMVERFTARRDAKPADNVVALPPRSGDVAAPGAEPDAAEPVAAEPVAAEPVAAEPVAAGVARIRAADSSFEPRQFLDGARGAFEIIVHAFASGDSAALRPLLSDEVYDRFAEAIRQRVAAKETHETHLVAIKSIDISEADLNGRTAFATVAFRSDQVNVTRAADGKVVDGDPEQVVEKTDFWTFARNTRSQDPNWMLVATRSA
jgi:predicted lipid-binding transport protein (Tim44 family)